MILYIYEVLFHAAIVFLTDPTFLLKSVINMKNKLPCENSTVRLLLESKVLFFLPTLFFPCKF